METWEAVRTNRAIRHFGEAPLPPELLLRIADAGRRAGSSKNLQHWQFILIQERTTLRRLADVGPWAGHLAAAAAEIALVTPDPRAAEAPLSVMFDLGRAAENMILTAWAAGIGSVPATVYDQALARSVLGYPDDHHCEYILSVGFPKDPDDLTRQPTPGGRRPLEAVLRRERW
jgi:nitroreductase